ncbi:uncharacterized protein LOC107883337 isoform X2 [Acyrthosiphon pisum]|uniref:Uncharacterized protein n=1 Tax=Acyrthosiphon pisum TaxID=7029 RepID=A0A8R2JVI1_ACYPI|nr:uncharacterized protein LOC107883337 isoform X2 [Acyrthosiphon pisum]
MIFTKNIFITFTITLVIIIWVEPGTAITDEEKRKYCIDLITTYTKYNNSQADVTLYSHEIANILQDKRWPFIKVILNQFDKNEIKTKIDTITNGQRIPLHPARVNTRNTRESYEKKKEDRPKREKEKEHKSENALFNSYNIFSYQETIMQQKSGKEMHYFRRTKWKNRKCML